MEIKLFLDGEYKTFKNNGRMSALRFKQSLAYSQALDKDFSDETMEAAVNFIANDLFEQQFTAEDFWNGVDVEEFTTVLLEALSAPSKRMQAKMQPLKN